MLQIRIEDSRYETGIEVKPWRNPMKTILTVLMIAVAVPASACPPDYYDCGGNICCPI